MSKKEYAAQLDDKLAEGLNIAYTNMLAFKKYKNSPVIIARDGQVVAVPANEMPPPTRVTEVNPQK